MIWAEIVPALAVRRHGGDIEAELKFVVQVQKQKLKIKRKRLAQYIGSEKLYPGQENDLDIVLESKQNRKARKQMGRNYSPGIEIVTPAEENPER